MAVDEAWVKLRALIDGEVQAMSWRLDKLTETERESLVDELTDRLVAKVQLT